MRNDCRERPDLWEELTTERRPIVVYGMGNGADKLFERLAALGLSVDGVCASDEFVRGQSFRSHRVLTLSEVCARYERPYVLVAFGTRLPSVIERLCALEEHAEVRVPDMPVVDTTFFDRAFARQYASELDAAFRLLADEPSRELFGALVEYKLTGRLRPLLSCTVSAHDVFDLIGHDVRVGVDLGAYRGDTAVEAVRECPDLSTWLAVEPDARNYKKLAALAEEERYRAVRPIRAAVSDHVGTAVFYGSGNRNASLSATSHSFRTDTVPLTTVDALTEPYEVDYGKYDVEGEELSALRGSSELIERCRPRLRVAVYHRSEDLFRLPLYLSDTAPFYRLYLRRTPCIPAWEVDLILKEM